MNGINNKLFQDCSVFAESLKIRSFRLSSNPSSVSVNCSRYRRDLGTLELKDYADERRLEGDYETSLAALKDIFKAWKKAGGIPDYAYLESLVKLLLATNNFTAVYRISLDVLGNFCFTDETGKCNCESYIRTLIERLEYFSSIMEGEHFFAELHYFISTLLCDANYEMNLNHEQLLSEFSTLRSYIAILRLEKGQQAKKEKEKQERLLRRKESEELAKATQDARDLLKHFKKRILSLKKEIKNYKNEIDNLNKNKQDLERKQTFLKSNRSNCVLKVVGIAFGMLISSSLSIFFFIIDIRLMGVILVVAFIFFLYKLMKFVFDVIPACDKQLSVVDISISDNAESIRKLVTKITDLEKQERQLIVQAHQQTDQYLSTNYVENNLR